MKRSSHVKQTESQVILYQNNLSHLKIKKITIRISFGGVGVGGLILKKCFWYLLFTLNIKSAQKLNINVKRSHTVGESGACPDRKLFKACEILWSAPPKAAAGGTQSSVKLAAIFKAI